jgi:hypothetical protein
MEDTELLRAALTEALDGWSRRVSQDHGWLKPDMDRIAELRKQFSLTETREHEKI